MGRLGPSLVTTWSCPVCGPLAAVVDADPGVQPANCPVCGNGMDVVTSAGQATADLVSPTMATITNPVEGTVQDTTAVTFN